MGTMKLQIGALIDELGKKRGQAVTLQTVSYESKLAYGTVLKWVNNKVDRYDAVTMAAFIDYFRQNLGRNVTVSDVLDYAD